jgi:hypothetical protein
MSDAPTSTTSSTAGQAAHQALTRARAELVDLVHLTASAATSYDRPDLAERLDRAESRLATEELNVLVVGEFKQGKSTLVNALLNAPVCGVADDVSTVIPTTVRFGAEPTATVRYRPVDEASEGRVEQIGIGDVATLGSEQGNPGNRAGIASIEVEIPRKLLRSGLALVDTPGVGGLDSTHGAVTAAALGMAELILFVSDASQPLTRSELDFLRSARRHGVGIALVQPKIDIQADWRRVVEANRAILAAEGIDVELLPVSSTLRQRAVADTSTELNEESGFPALLALLRDAGAGETARQLLRTAAADVAFVVDQLHSTFESRRATLEDPDASSQVIARLEEAKERAERLRSQSAKWQQTLNDGGQDLSSDLDHDLRVRFRTMLAESDAALDDGDPAEIWEEFEQWLHTRIGFELSSHHQLIARRSNELAARVAEHFAEDEEALGVALSVPVPSVRAKELDHSIELQRSGLSGSALAAVRGSYGGLLMFGMVGQMVGLAMINPLSIVIGLGLGRRGLREEKRRQLQQRRQQAKMAVRKYADDINVEASKTTRDTVRRAHRELRDEFGRRAEQLQTTIRESLKDAETTVRDTLAERQQQLADVRAELERVGGLRNRLERTAARIEGTPS